MIQSEKVADLEKSNRTLQNEKAVLAAAVEARESKLVKMEKVQTSFDQLSEKVVQQDALRVELEESNKRYQELQRDLDQVTQFEKECRADLDHATQKVETLTTRIQKDEQSTASVHSQLDSLQKKNQQLKGERNNFKQKNDSLSKEISRLCRNGRTIKDIEKTLADHEALREEVQLLRQQKRMALEDAHLYRTSYEQSKVAQKLAGMDYETHAALERNAELDRLLAEMTEYLEAKEMQLDTMKLVNEHLQSEIHSLAKANLSKNEV
jgi:chromosome segregation ATPase